MTTAITYTVADALDMLTAAGVNAAAELSNIDAAYADICDEIERAGGIADFGAADLAAALRNIIR